MRLGVYQLLALAVVSMLAAPVTSLATDLYTNEFEVDLPGPGSDGFYTYSGTGSGDETLTWDPEITETGGVGGTQSLAISFDYSTVGGQTWWYGGLGTYAAFADDDNPFAGGVAGTENPACYRVSFDIKVTGNDGSGGATPIGVGVSNYDGEYDTTYGIDGNGNGEVDGANVYYNTVEPTLVDGADYTHVSFLLSDGTISADTNVPVPTFDNTSPLFFSINFGNTGFGYNTGNSISIDNVLIEFLDTVPAVPGDYNGDGVTDAADYTVWRDNLNATGTPGEVTGDGTGSDLAGNPDGVVDEYDFEYWKINFGASSAGAGASALAAVAVPEPASLALVLCAVLGLAAARRFRG
jgi:hypothetical protein